MTNGEMLTVLERIIDGEDVFGEDVTPKAISLLTLAGVHDVRNAQQETIKRLDKIEEVIEENETRSTSNKSRLETNRTEITRLRNRGNRNDLFLGVSTVIGTIIGSIFGK